MTDWGPEEIAEREADQAEAEADGEPEFCPYCGFSLIGCSCGERPTGRKEGA